MERYIKTYKQFVNEAKKIKLTAAQKREQKRLIYAEENGIELGTFKEKELVNILKKYAKKLAPIFIDTINSSQSEVNLSVDKISEIKPGFGRFDNSWEALRHQGAMVTFDDIGSNSMFRIFAYDIKSKTVNTPVYFSYGSVDFALSPNIKNFAQIQTNFIEIVNLIGNVYKEYESIGLDKSGRDIYRVIAKLAYSHHTKNDYNLYSIIRATGLDISSFGDTPKTY
jgi:hypothetical protein